jgi:hypothetical protein
LHYKPLTKRWRKQRMKRRILVSAFVSVLLLAVLAANVHAAEVKITASDGAAGEHFGASVTISGDCSVVGAPWDSDAGSASGSAYIFKRDGTAWTQEDKITASDGAAGDLFGASVAISGDYAVVGAPWNDDAGAYSGSAYIFKRNGTAWTEQAKITASYGAADDRFGTIVAISGDYAVVGACGGDSAYIFKRNGAAWNEQAKVTASDGAEYDFFGPSVAISGDYAVVGARGDDDHGEYSGSAYIFKRNGTAWTEQAKITASDGAEYDFFGGSVAISGDYAVVGANHDDDAGFLSGSAYIFKRNGTAWTEQAKVTASDGAAGDSFGWSVAISGDYVVAGARCDDDTGSVSGSAYIFRYNGTAWTEQAKITASDGAAGDFFGFSVAISGGCAVVGAWMDDDAGTDSGSAHIFKRDGTAWIQEGKITASDGAADDQFGASVASSSDYAVVGAYGADDAGSYSGSAYIFTIRIIDPGAAIALTEYDIVADNQSAGVVGAYNASSDLLDSRSVAGIVASVPELATVVMLTLIGLLALAGYFRYNRRKN